MMDQKNRMNILYCIDETKKDYSRFLGVSILSLLENNKDEDINIYVITTKLEEENKNELERIVALYGKNIKFSTNVEVIPNSIKNKLPKNGWHISTYYRLFFSRCFKEIKNRLLYLDCDTIINKNLSDFYNSNFNNNIIIGGLDIPLTRYESQKRIGTEINNYINAGVILINIDKYLSYNIGEEINHIINNYNIKYCDQDCINIMFKGKIGLYNNLQKIITTKFNKSIGNSLVIHTVAKPDHPFSQCPNKIIKIFDNYLERTKRKNFYENKKYTFRRLIDFIYLYIKNFITHACEKLFGEEVALKVYNFYFTTYIKIMYSKFKRYFGVR